MTNKELVKECSSIPAARQLELGKLWNSLENAYSFALKEHFLVASAGQRVAIKGKEGLYEQYKIVTLGSSPAEIRFMNKYFSIYPRVGSDIIYVQKNPEGVFLVSQELVVGDDWGFRVRFDSAILELKRIPAKLVKELQKLQ